MRIFILLAATTLGCSSSPKGETGDTPEQCIAKCRSAAKKCSAGSIDPAVALKCLEEIDPCKKKCG